MRVGVAVSGSVEELESIWVWFQAENKLRGRVSMRSHLGSESAMGSHMELILATAASSPLVAVLANSVAVWLTNRHADIRVTVTSKNGRQIEVSGLRLKDPSKVIQAALDATNDDGRIESADSDENGKPDAPSAH